VRPPRWILVLLAVWILFGVVPIAVVLVFHR
jgi:hypothetical protein